MSDNEKNVKDIEKECLDRICNANKKPDVRMIVNHFETSFVVYRPGSDEPICYCTSKEAADFVSHSVKIASDVAMITFIHKAFN